MNLRKFHFIKLLYLSRPVLLLVRKFCSVNFRLPGVIHSASNILHLLKGKLPIHVFSSRKIENKMVLYILFTTSELHVRYQKGDRSMREEVVVKALTDTLPLSNPAQNSQQEKRSFILKSLNFDIKHTYFVFKAVEETKQTRLAIGQGFQGVAAHFLLNPGYLKDITFPCCCGYCNEGKEENCSLLGNSKCLILKYWILQCSKERRFITSAVSSYWCSYSIYNLLLESGTEYLSCQL